jgi:hypothetical protein
MSLPAHFSKLIVAVGLSVFICSCVKAPQKQLDAHMQVQQRVHKILIAIMHVPEDKLVKNITLHKLGLRQGDEDFVITALEKEFNKAVPRHYVIGNATVEELVAYFGDRESISIKQRELEDFGPLAPVQQSNSELEKAQVTASASSIEQNN